MTRYYVTNSFFIAGQQYPGAFSIPRPLVQDYASVDWSTFRRTPDGLTAAEAVDVLYQAASENPTIDDVARLLEAKWTLEAALGIKVRK